jgi:ATP-dependent protease ClpP protease subunit
MKNFTLRWDDPTRPKWNRGPTRVPAKVYEDLPEKSTTMEANVDAQSITLPETILEHHTKDLIECVWHLENSNPPELSKEGKKKLSKARKGPLTIFVDSNGGDVMAALNMREVIAKLREGRTVRTVVTGRAYSAGSLLASCGSKGHRLAMTGSQFMVHAPQMGYYGDYILDIIPRLPELEKVYARLLVCYGIETSRDERGAFEETDVLVQSLTFDEIQQRGGEYFGPSRAISLGLIDKTLSSLSELTLPETRHLSMN